MLLSQALKLLVLLQQNFLYRFGALRHGTPPLSKEKSAKLWLGRSLRYFKRPPFKLPQRLRPPQPIGKKKTQGSPARMNDKRETNALRPEAGRSPGSFKPATTLSRGRDIFAAPPFSPRSTLPTRRSWKIKDSGPSDRPVISNS